MRFIFINQGGRSEQESDYDTAVDMSHWSFYEATYTLQTPTGLKIELISTHEHVTHSYYEPDFDRMDKTGETVYQQHSDHSNDNTTENWRATATMPMVLPEMSAQDFLHLDLIAQNNQKAQEFANQAKLWDYQEFKAGYCEEETELSLSQEDIQSMIEQISQAKVKKGFSIELTLSEQANTMIKQISEEHLNLQNKNLDTRLNNQCAQAEYHLNEKLERLMKEAIMQLKEQWHEQDLNRKRIKP